MGCALLSKPPCKGCEDRHERCHIKCPDYIEWCNIRRAEEKKANRAFIAESITNGYQIREIEKKKRKRR